MADAEETLDGGEMHDEDGDLHDDGLQSESDSPPTSLAGMPSQQALFKQMARQRRDLIRAMIAKGMMPGKYGFNRMVAAKCDEAGLAHNPASISRDVTWVLGEIERDKTVSIGKQRLLEMSGTAVQDLALLDVTKPDVVTRRITKRGDGTEMVTETIKKGKVDPIAFLKRSKEQREWYRFIAELQGYLKVKGTGDTNVLNFMNQLSTQVQVQIAGMTDPAEIYRLLVREMGEEEAKKFLGLLGGE